MLTEERYEVILSLLEKRKSLKVADIKDELGISESTIRRDLNALDKAGKLCKVFGGAVSIKSSFLATELSVTQKLEVRIEEKREIARYAASLIRENDFVFLDAGTTTGYMIEYITAKSATFVTNAVSHAKQLAIAGFKVILIGGELKGMTEAIIGSAAILSLQNYHFTKGFFGANGVDRKGGFSTPDTNEALVKKTAMKQCEHSYMLVDNSKFNQVSSYTFAPLFGVTVITDKELGQEYQDYNIVYVNE